jgi:hypothetical protein
MINRRELGQLAGMTLAAVSLAGCTSKPASAPSSADAHTSFASVKQVDAGLLNIGYAEDGPPDGKPVILLRYCTSTPGPRSRSMELSHQPNGCAPLCRTRK